MSDKAAKEQALIDYRNAWKGGSVIEAFYSDDVNFYAPMKVFSGKGTVIPVLANFFLIIDSVTDISYVIGKNSAVMLSQVFLKNTGGDLYSLREYDYFEFNEYNQISLYRPIFDSGNATHEFLGFETASRCAQARKLSDNSQTKSSNFHNENRGILYLAKTGKLEPTLSDDCTMEWPWLYWKGKEKTLSALQSLCDNAIGIELLFSGEHHETNASTYLYKIAQENKPVLWVGFWIKKNNENQVTDIRLVFDSFEYFIDENTVNLFGLEGKALRSPKKDEKLKAKDDRIVAIIQLLNDFFSSKYGQPIQNTELAKSRLLNAANEANKQLMEKSKCNIVLPFFSANEKRPIQFFAAVILNKDGDLKVLDT